MAAFAGLQGGFMSDDAQLPEGENHIEPGVYKRTKMTAEELARAFYTPPFKDPPEAMYRIFEVLIEAGRRFASTTEEMVGDASNTGPVGTTIALIEQSSKVFSGIHRRLHVAQAEELSLRAELNAEFLPEEYPYEIEGESRVIFKRDYDAKVDVIPVSDPNIFSSAQRIAQGQAVLELAERFPAEIDSTDAVKRFLKAIKVPDYETLLKTGSQVRRDAVSENMLIMVGKPVKAFAEQDHDAHIAVHMGLMGAINDDAKGVVGMAMQAHLAEHYAFAYYNVMNQQAGGMLPPPTWMDGSDSDEEPPPEADMLISQAAAQMQVPQIMPPTEGGPDAEAMEAEAKIARAQQQFEAEQANRQRAFEADEARKQQAADAEEYRKSVAFDADEERKDAATEAEMDRKLALAINEDERKTYSAEQADARAQISERRAARTKPKAGGK
jgi:hypothetical protein